MAREPEAVVALRHALGKQLATLRQLAQLTQAELAKATFCDRTRVAHLERGSARADEAFWRRADEHCQADGVLLASFRHLESIKQAHEVREREAQLAAMRARATEHQNYLAVQPEEPQNPETDDVRRRNFISAMAGLAASLPTVAQASYGRRVSDTQTKQLLARTARLRRLDDFLGGADTYRLYASELQATSGFVKDASCTQETRQALTAVIAEQAQLAGWAAFDAGMHTEATLHFETSREAATEANDATLAGNALAFLAYQQISTDAPNIQMATASYATAERSATPRVKALLLERMAWTHAVAGQAQETERALNQAADALEQPATRPEPDWVFWVDDVEMNIMAGRCWTELRRPLRAIPTLETVLARYDDTHARDKALYLTWLAHAYLDAGEVEQAALVTSRAVELATGVASVRPIARISRVLERLQPYRAIPAVADTLELGRSDATSS
jgi:transcriptional regulator with XRE-family HTH domain